MLTSHAHFFAIPGEYFEVYSPPIVSQYSEVVWRTLDPVPLPSDVVARYANGGVMAVTGFEVNVVRRNKTTGEETSVPCSESYNHHYVSILKSSLATMEPLVNGQPTGPNRFGHGPTHVWHAAAGSSANQSTVPLVQTFSEHNGNEARQTYHGYPDGYVQIIESPEHFIFNPMQINTRNPNGSSAVATGPLPRTSAAPEGAHYSGILECPCTTRIKKTYGGYITTADGGACAVPVTGGGDACFAAAAALFGAGALHSNTSLPSFNASLPAGCSVVPTSADLLHVTSNAPAGGESGAPCGGDTAARRVAGGTTPETSPLVSLHLDVDEDRDLVTITMAAANGKNWFGVGFNAQVMGSQPYTVIVDGEGRVSERKLGNHAAGSALSPSLTVVSNTVTGHGAKRTVVMTRPLKGATPDHYDFSPVKTTLNFIAALGATPDLQQHKARGSFSLTMVARESSEAAGDAPPSTCVCKGGTGTIDGVAYDPQCATYPLSSLRRDRNPTCDVSTYGGGMACCRDGTFLLDADQEVPPHVDEVFYRWRFYFQDWEPARHTPLFHVEWAVNGCDSAGGNHGNSFNCHHIEYDVPRAAPGTPPEETVYEVTSSFQTRDMMSLECEPRTDSQCADAALVDPAKGIELVMAGGHCHSPSCLSLELFNADTNTSICRIEPVLGTSAEGAAWNELGYLWLPPCQWSSDPASGLKPPPVLHLDTNLTTVKRTNNTNAHWGVMGIWQMRGAYVT